MIFRKVVCSMKKTVGWIAVLIFCCIAAVDLIRMVKGLAFGWDNILLGIVIAALCWNYLLKKEAGFLVSLMKSAGLVAVIMCVGLVLNNSKSKEPISDFGQSSSYRFEEDDYVFDYDAYDDDFSAEEEPFDRIQCHWCHGSGICPECGGTGRNDATGVLAAVGCTLCDKTGECVKCGGDGFLEVY